MNAPEQDKAKQWIALIGGMLGALLLFLNSLGVSFAWFNNDSINAFTNFLITMVPFILVIYGIYKNQYILTQKAKEQEELLKEHNKK